MTNKRVENKPSETAMFAALHRAMANKYFKNEKFGPDYLAEYFLPSHFRFFIKFKKIRANIKKKLDKLLPGLHEYMIARTAWLDSLFVKALNNKIPQIVLLGAGYDTRAYRFAEHNIATKVFDLDIATTQARKKACLQKAKIEVPKSVSLVSIDFNKQSLQNVLAESGYDSQQKTLFLWEGVSYYLQPESVDATLGFVSSSEDLTSLLAFDYAVSITEKNRSAYGVTEFLNTMKKQHGDEALLFSVAEGNVGSFLEQRGLRVISHLNKKEIEQTFLAGENGASIGSITGHFRFVSASPMLIET